MPKRTGLIAVVALVVLGGCTGAAPAQRPEPEPQTSQGSQQLRPAGQAEYVAAYLACMQERGWEGHVIPNGGIQWEGFPAEQRDQYDADSTECDEIVEWTGPEAPPLSDALFELNYQRVSAAYRCLVEHGLPVEPLPSFQQWRDRLEAFSDYTVTGQAREAELNGVAHYSGAVEQDCPDPDAFFFDVTTRIYPDDVDYAAYEAAT